MICPICLDSSKKTIADQVDYKGPIFTEIYEIINCNNCGTQFCIPARAAPPEYYDYSVPEWRWEFGVLINDAKTHLNEKAYILEIGCNDGNCLVHISKFNFNLLGTDFNEVAIEKAKKRGLNCQTWSIDELIQKGYSEYFNLIYFFHVLEHVENPYDFLCDIKKLLKKDGIICFSVPNPERLTVYSVREKDDYPPNHLYRYTINGIEKLLERSGYKIDKVANQPRDINFLNFLSFKVHKILTGLNLNFLYNNQLPRLIRALGKLPVFIALLPWGICKYFTHRHKPGLAMYVRARIIP